jgi:hypothetical protein
LEIILKSFLLSNIPKVPEMGILFLPGNPNQDYAQRPAFASGGDFYAPPARRGFYLEPGFSRLTGLFQELHQPVILRVNDLLLTI